jgi:hypothetical protein
MYAHTHPFWFYPFTCLVPGVPEAQRLFGQDRQLELRGSRSAEPSNSLVQDEILAENRREDIPQSPTRSRPRAYSGHPRPRQPHK